MGGNGICEQNHASRVWVRAVIAVIPILLVASIWPSECIRGDSELGACASVCGHVNHADAGGRAISRAPPAGLLAVLLGTSGWRSGRIEPAEVYARAGRDRIASEVAL